MIKKLKVKVTAVRVHAMKAYGRLKFHAPAIIPAKNILRHPLQRGPNVLHSRSGRSGKYMLVI
jgi:hypothetical protein